MDQAKLEEAIRKMGQDKGEDLEHAFKAISDKIFRHAMTPKEIFKISEEKIEALYAEAYRLFTSGKFKEAVPFFETLSLIDGEDSRFLFGLGMSFFRQKKYKEALGSFLALARLDDASVESLFYAGECSFHLREPNTTLLFLDMAIKRAGDKKEWVKLKERALLMKKAIIEKVKKEKGGVK